ncbi:MAG: hypothetical protein ACPL5F_01535 [Moorellaceae bacterium]
MRTVSLEMAKKLKEAGLQWEPTEGDVFVALGDQNDVLAYTITPPRVIYMDKERNLWLPTLSDLLEWLEGRGYYVDMYAEKWGSKRIYGCELGRPDSIMDAVCLVAEFTGDSYEDVAAKAVLWVLEQKAGKGD